MHLHQSQSGNAFWIILLAIALLVALTITITRTSENTEESGSRDRNRIQASDILRQAKSIEQAIDQMRSRGVAENEISFENSFISGYSNTKCGDGALNTDDDRCRIYHPAGAGLTYKTPSPDWLDKQQSASALYGEWYLYGTACIPGVGTGDAGCKNAVSSTDLILALPWIRRDLCVEINRLAGVQNLTGPVRPPQIDGSAYKATLDKFTGTFEADSEIDNGSAAFTGHQGGCFEGNSANPDGGYHFYYAVIQR